MGLRIAYYWLTLGPYHIERMRAIAERPEVESLTVFQAAATDDHGWALDFGGLPFTVITLSRNVLSRRTEFSAFLELRRMLKNRDFRFDVFVNGAGFTNLFLNEELASHAFKNVLWTESTALDNPDQWLKRKIKEKAIRNYDLAIAAGSRHKQYLEKLGFKNPIHVVGNVVGRNGTENERIIEKEKLILFVGRFISQKSADLLIRAFKRDLSALFPEWKLVLIGDGPEREFWLKEAGSLAGNRILFPGSQFGDVLQNWYDRAAVFVLPSSSEPWGLVVNEAMQAGCAVLVSDVCGCVPDLIIQDKSGLAFPNGDEEALRETLKKLLESAEFRLKIGAGGQKQIAAFTPETYAAQCIRAFS